MKRFHWRLQRVLDVTAQREDILRTELVKLQQTIIRLRQDVLARRLKVRRSMDNLSSWSLEDRISGQDAVMLCVAAMERDVAAVEEIMVKQQQCRSEKADELMKVRSSRQTLERLRGEALGKHMREQERLDQKELDDRAQVSFVRSQRQSKDQAA
ncbi:MAG: hypothetical protein ACYS8X_02860 [Planctomycetota bacterium]|jgi:flagellar biosynthesis chaperone FliJ